MKYFIVILLLLLISALQYLKIVEIDNNTILFIIIAIMLFFWSCSNNELEHYSPSQTDLEAISSLATMYDSGTLTVSNLNVTGTSTLTGDLTVKGTSALTGDVTMSGNANVTGDLNVGTNNFTVYGNPTANNNTILEATTTDKANSFMVHADGKGTYGWYNTVNSNKPLWINYFIGGSSTTNNDPGGGSATMDSFTMNCNNGKKHNYLCQAWGAPHSNSDVKLGSYGDGDIVNGWELLYTGYT